jgi:hypothetical protein
LESIDGPVIIHVDMSGTLRRSQTVGIAWTSATDHRGCSLDAALIRKLRQLDIEYSTIYALCIAALIRNHLDKISTIVICNDEPFCDVKAILETVFRNNEAWRQITVKSISEFRREMNDPFARSLADNIANAYRRRARRPNRHHLGVPLNVVPVTITTILELQNK